MNFTFLFFSYKDYNFNIGPYKSPLIWLCLEFDISLRNYYSVQTPFYKGSILNVIIFSYKMYVILLLLPLLWVIHTSGLNHCITSLTRPVAPFLFLVMEGRYQMLHERLWVCHSVKSAIKTASKASIDSWGNWRVGSIQLLHVTTEAKSIRVSGAYLRPVHCWRDTQPYIKSF